MDLAVSIIRRLREAGHAAYLYRWLRPRLLLGRAAKDFDVATSASPDELLRLFPGAGQVGAQFGVVLVHEGQARRWRWRLSAAIWSTSMAVIRMASISK